MNERELKNLVIDWIKNIDSKETVPESIEGINFGIYGTNRGYSMYLIGSKYYDEEDDMWTCDEDFVPEDKYLKNLPISKSISCEAVVDTMIKLLKDIINEFSDLELFKVDHITSGFDNMELYIIK